MFGTLRFLLASTVVLYHASYKPCGMYIGITAVMIFYIISGYVMSGLYNSRYRTIENAHFFYIDRFLRIAPQYYFYLALTFFVFHKPWTWNTDFFQPICLTTFISNVLLLPLGLTPYLASVRDVTPMFPLIATTFSLANEVLFYLLVPIILVTPFATFGMAILSLTFFCLATNNIIPNCAFSYWVLPGPLIFFLIGHFICQKKWFPLVLTMLILCGNHVLLIISGFADKANEASTGFTLDIYNGLYLGVLAILILRNFSSNRIDDWLGSISYGMFLCHLPLMHALGHLTPRLMQVLESHISLLILTSSCFGAFSFYVIEKPIRKYGRKIQMKIQNLMSNRRIQQQNKSEKAISQAGGDLIDSPAAS